MASMYGAYLTGDTPTTSEADSHHNPHSVFLAYLKRFRWSSSGVITCPPPLTILLPDNGIDPIQSQGLGISPTEPNPLLSSPARARR